MSEAYCQVVDESIGQSKTLSVSRVMFHHCIVGKDDNGNDVIGSDNLMDYIGKKCKKTNGRVLFERRAAWSDYQSKESRQLLTNELVKAFSAEGVGIANRGWLSDRYGSIYRCQRGKMYKDQSTATTPSKKRRTSTIKPTEKEDVCGFMFSVQWSTDDNCWYIKGGKGCSEHTNHTGILKEPSDLRRSRKMLDPKEKTVGVDRNEIHGRQYSVGREEMKLSRVADRDEIITAIQDATHCTDPTQTSNKINDSSDEIAKNQDNELHPHVDHRSCPAEWQAWLEAISKITDACPEAYQHVSKAWPKLYHECNEIAARYKKQPATDKDTVGMVS